MGRLLDENAPRMIPRFLNGVGFSGENEEFVRSPSLNCNSASLTQSLLILHTDRCL
jgi:hypothetical protein